MDVVYLTLNNRYDMNVISAVLEASESPNTQPSLWAGYKAAEQGTADRGDDTDGRSFVTVS